MVTSNNYYTVYEGQLVGSYIDLLMREYCKFRYLNMFICCVLTILYWVPMLM